jgi:murein DD-endopeptidase MepM/ murein hydrolase activator NlpD
MFLKEDRVGGYILPFRPRRGKEMLCVNTHIINLTVSGVIVTAVAGILLGPLEAVLTAVYQAIYMGTQADAVDIIENSDDPGMGAEVVACGPGRVVAAEDGMNDGAGPGTTATLAGMLFIPIVKRLMGNHVIVDHGEVHSVYAHLKRGSVRVREGDRVGAGDAVGMLGNSGSSTAPHLHFQFSRIGSSHMVVSAKARMAPFQEIVIDSGMDFHARNALTYYRSATKKMVGVDVSAWRTNSTGELPVCSLIRSLEGR